MKQTYVKPGQYFNFLSEAVHCTYNNTKIKGLLHHDINFNLYYLYGCSTYQCLKLMSIQEKVLYSAHPGRYVPIVV